MLVPHDYHIHSTYSDGTGLPWMVAAAEEAGLEAIGFSDHCNVSERESAIHEKYEQGFNLDLTYERRREAIEGLRERTELTIYDPSSSTTTRATRVRSGRSRGGWIRLRAGERPQPRRSRRSSTRCPTRTAGRSSTRTTRSSSSRSCSPSPLTSI